MVAKVLPEQTSIDDRPVSPTLRIRLNKVSYSTTNNRLQITTVDGLNPADKIHEDAGDGRALCGTGNYGLRPNKGQPAKFTARGPGQVTCGNCERLTSP
jgi:hypothetical protein